jgi:hypothetical protein
MTYNVMIEKGALTSRASPYVFLPLDLLRTSRKIADWKRRSANEVVMTCCTPYAANNERKLSWKNSTDLSVTMLAGGPNLLNALSSISPT